MFFQKLKLINKQQLKKNYSDQTASYFLLHLIVLIYGFTAILGKLISIEAISLVWYRMVIAFVALVLFYKVKKIDLKIPLKAKLKMLGCGGIIAAHWIFFFESINISNVSVALIALAATPLFVAIVEPIFFKRRIALLEILMGGVSMIGFSFIIGDGAEVSLGLIMGVVATFLVAFFAVFNGLLIKDYTSYQIAYYEMFGGVISISLYYLLFDCSLGFFSLPSSDVIWLLVLGIICTAFPFVGTVGVMKKLTPFTVALTLSLEPVYGMLIALIIFGQEELMSWSFYLGTIIILCTLIGNVMYKRYVNKKAGIIKGTT